MGGQPQGGNEQPRPHQFVDGAQRRQHKPGANDVAASRPVRPDHRAGAEHAQGQADDQGDGHAGPGVGNGRPGGARANDQHLRGQFGPEGGGGDLTGGPQPAGIENAVFPTDPGPG